MEYITEGNLYAVPSGGLVGGWGGWDRQAVRWEGWSKLEGPRSASALSPAGTKVGNYASHSLSTEPLGTPGAPSQHLVEFFIEFGPTGECLRSEADLAHLRASLMAG